jgi:hypothetical protein
MQSSSRQYALRVRERHLAGADLGMKLVLKPTSPRMRRFQRMLEVTAGYRSLTCCRTLRLDMLSEMPAIITRRTSIPPRMLRTVPRPPAFFLITLTNLTTQPPNKIFNRVSCVIQQLDNY